MHRNVCLPACDPHPRGIHGGREQSVMAAEMWVAEEGGPRIVPTIPLPRCALPTTGETMALTP